MSAWWSDGSGRLVLQLPVEVARTASHSGDCECDVRDVLARPEAQQQVRAWSVEDVRENLSEYGAWDDVELADHEMNLVRTLWLACGHIVEDALTD